MTDTSIRVENLSKRFRIRSQGHFRAMHEVLENAVKHPMRRLANSFQRQTESSRASFPSSHIWALQDISFEVKRGEMVGLIGKNGSGKSVLLKILSRITRPTMGSAQLRGRIGSMLEVGTGFHPELSGRENIFLNGTILGMKRAEISRKFDEIATFSEVEKFLDMPVKRYSSGMRVRLAFSIAAHLDAEILLLDEVLAVADESFHQKCVCKLEDVAKEGRTIVFVSHDMSTLDRICRRTIFLREGCIDMDGPTGEVVAHYLRINRLET